MSNVCFILGNVGNDPVLHKTSKGKPVTNLHVATNDVWYNEAGERQTTTTWHRVAVFGTDAVNVANYVKKGRQVHVQGKMRNRSYEKDGVTHYVSEIFCQTIEFLGNRKTEETVNIPAESDSVDSTDTSPEDTKEQPETIL